ncbi:hypothetical protein [Pseudoalteromonas spongiae]|uniref:hypothetical protein n=1 Tax=Pseudoalteromonas spongiae TaxID=298657 RepID=UPI003735491A
MSENAIPKASSEFDYTAYQFVAWVPCLTGQLSYSVCEAALGDEGTKFSFTYKSSKEQRSCQKHKIALTSVVNWRDRKKSDGRWNVFMVAETCSESKHLFGSVYISPAALSHNIEHLKDEFRQLRKMDECPESEVNSAFAKFEKNVRGFTDSQHANSEKGCEYYRVDFFLHNCGLTYLKAMRSGDGIEQSLNDYVLCRQSFYYLKFALHKHKHHPSNIDSVTTVHPLLEDKEELGNHLLFDLKQSLIDIKRAAGAEKTQFNFLGITSYKRSLIEACKKHALMSDDAYKRELSLADNTEKSYSAIQDKVNSEQRKSIDSRNEARQVILLIFAILAPWVIIAKKSSEANSFLSSFLVNIYSDDTKTLFLMGLLLLFYFVTTTIFRKHSTVGGVITSYRGVIEPHVRDPIKAGILAVITLCIGLYLVGSSIVNVLVSS